VTKKRHCPICGSGDYNYPPVDVSPAYMFCSNCGLDSKRLEDYRKLELGDERDNSRFYLRRDPIERLQVKVSSLYSHSESRMLGAKPDLFYYKVSGLLLLDDGSGLRVSLSDREIDLALERSRDSRNFYLEGLSLIFEDMTGLAEFRVFLRRVRQTEKYLSQIFLERRLKLCETVLSIRQ